jgi:hypothetical protein
LWWNEQGDYHRGWDTSVKIKKNIQRSNSISKWNNLSQQLKIFLQPKIQSHLMLSNSGGCPANLAKFLNLAKVKSAKSSKKSAKISRKNSNFQQNFEIRERCKGVYCVELGESFPTSSYFQNLVSVQPRTSLISS